MTVGLTLIIILIFVFLGVNRKIKTPDHRLVLHSLYIFLIRCLHFVYANWYVILESVSWPTVYYGYIDDFQRAILFISISQEFFNGSYL